MATKYHRRIRRKKITQKDEEINLRISLTEILVVWSNGGGFFVIPSLPSALHVLPLCLSLVLSPLASSRSPPAHLTIYTSKKKNKEDAIRKDTNTLRFWSGERRREGAGGDVALLHRGRKIRIHRFEARSGARRGFGPTGGNGRETGSLELRAGRVNCAFLPANVCY